MTTELETKPGADPQGQAAPATPATPETGAEGANAQPSAAGTEPSNVVPKEQYEAAVRAMNEKMREAAEARAQADFYQRISQAAAGVNRQADDPLAAAEQEWDSNPYDPSVAKKVMALREQRLRQEMRNEFLQSQHAMQALPRAQEILGVANPEQAAQMLTEELRRPKTLDEAAILRKYREGKLHEWAAEDQKAREYRAKQALLSGPNGMGPGGRVTPGTGGAPQRRVVISWPEWAAANEDAKNALRKDLNNPNVEYAFSDVPEAVRKRGFDPMKE